MDQPDTIDHPEFWRAAIDSLSAHVAILDGEGRILAVNQAWRSFAEANGYADPRACIGVNYLEVCRQATAEEAPEAGSAAFGVAEVLAGRRREFSLAYPCHAPERKRWFMLRVTPFQGPDPARLVVAHENITSAKAAQLRAAEYARGLEAANLDLRQQADALDRAEALENAAGRILELVARNEPLNTVLGETARLVERQFPGCSCAVAVARGSGCELNAARTLSPALLERMNAAATQALADAASPSSTLAAFDRAIREAGDRPEDALHLSLIRGAAGEWYGAVLVCGLPDCRRPERDHTLARAASLAAVAVDHKRMHDQLAFQALHDPLTGLPNRLLFHDRVQQAIAASRREGGSLAVLAVDLDRFKRVQEVHGARVRDVLLLEVARRIQEAAGERDTVAHSGGDEFLLLLQEPEHAADPEQVARRISTIFESPLAALDRDFHLACAVGVSRYPGDGATAPDLVRNAGTALYEAKQGRPGSCRFFEPGMGTLARERIEIERCLRGAAANGEIDLHYQPQFDREGRAAAVEALMRWTSPVLGSVPPSRFIPVAEQSGLIVSVGGWALRRACLQSTAWGRVGLGNVRMAVNVSALQLMRADFAGAVACVLDETGMDPSLLELEVTESAMMRDLQTALEQIRLVRRLGVSIAVDDFGIGYSSLSYIQKLPVDVLKIDRSFVQELDQGGRNGDSLVRTIVSLAHTFGMRVVAEGVETESQFHALAAAGCDLCQGHLLCRPMSAAKVEEFLLGAASAANTPVTRERNRDILAREASS
jgi:diguanylate cyclase (GGDEF)-like protein